METPAVYRPVLFDLGPLSPSQTDAALEAIYKAQSDEPPEQADIWEPHHSNFVRDLIERFTAHGLDRLEAVRAELAAWETGERHVPSRDNVPRPGLHPRWTPDEIALAKLYLESLPPAEWGLDDWVLASELAFQQYLPQDFAWTEADWLSKRAVIMGQVQARLPEISAELAQAMLDAETLPTPYEKALQAAVEFGRARCAENIVQLSDSLRHRVRKVIIDHVEQQTLNSKPESLQTKLFDEFAVQSRDWRRIAVTEAGNMVNVGMVASQKPGNKLQRSEHYANSCSYCRKVNGRIFTVVPDDKPYKDPETEIWPSKSNYGRSQSPRKRVGPYLIPRTPEEMWIVPAGTIHPHCRGTWINIHESKGSGDDEFDKWVEEQLSKLK